jgi:hypothetical protein
MSTTSRVAAVIAAAALALTAACGGATDDTGATSAPAASPTSEQPTSTEVPDEAALSAALLTAEDLGDGWREFGLGDEQIMPGVGLPCEDGSSELSAPQWQVGARFSLETRETEGRYSPPVLDEYLFASDPAELEQLFLTLREALDACVGEVREGGDDASVITEIEVVDLDGLGDQALRVRVSDTAVDTPGDAVLGEGRLVLVRSGATLVRLLLYEGVTVADYTGQEIDLVVTDADLDGIVAEALDKLP